MDRATAATIQTCGEQAPAMFATALAISNANGEAAKNRLSALTTMARRCAPIVLANGPLSTKNDHTSGAQMTRREEMLAERAELIAKNEAATSWGAAVGARSERIKEINRHLAAMDAEEKRLSQPEPGYVAGFEDGLRAAADWHKRRATLERKVGLESSAKAEDYAANAIAALPAPATASAGEEVTVDEMARFLDPDAFDGTTDPNLRIRRNQFITQKARALLSTYKITKRSAT